MFHRNTEKIESLIGNNSVFRGSIETKDTLRIDGTVEGNVRADWVIVGEKALVKGDIEARGIVLGGRVEGNLKALETVEMKSKGQLIGDIFTAKLTVTEGAIFEGRSKMESDETNVVELPLRGKSK
jgi:cytoskeletal protein CcmA (bactofilin family)